MTRSGAAYELPMWEPPTEGSECSSPHGLLPTPAVNDMGEGKTVEWWDDWTARMKERSGNGNGHGKSLADRVAETVGDAHGLDRGLVSWGEYAPAVERWEDLLGRPAPAPTTPGVRGGQQLSPRFVEWLMGLPDGHVTDVPGLSRNDHLRALGNGVVWQQAAAALSFLLTSSSATSEVAA